VSARSWWAPATVLAAGAVLVAAGSQQRSMPLRAPLAETIPARVGAWTGRDRVIGAEERRVAGMDDYLMRSYGAGGAPAAFSLYVGYYRSQAQGRSIHSPKNCLPGAGWEALTTGTMRIATAAGAVDVNRALLQNDGHRALVLYWYQGRGRVTADEYAVKWNLLRDAALRRRTEEALVRVIVPVDGSEARAQEVAVAAAQAAVPAVARALPQPG
jgi:EpsI family protein